MALRSVRNRSIPSDAIELDRDEAVTFQYNLVRDWQPQSDVKMLRYSIGGLGIASALSGIYINNYFRYRMRLQSFARMSTYMPVVVVPATLAMLFHQKLVKEPIMLSAYTCPICLETRAAVVQGIFGFAFPMVVSPLSSFMMATRYYTYNVPPVTQPKAVFQLWRKLTRPVATFMTILLLLQMSAGCLVAYLENSGVERMNERLNMIEEKIKTGELK